MTTPRTTVSQVAWPRGLMTPSSIPNLRRGALMQALVFGLAGTWMFFGPGHAAFARVLWGLGSFALVIGLVAPSLFRPAHRLGLVVGRLFGAGLTWILLTPAYVLGFGLAATWLRLRGADPLQRRPLPPGYSYWIRRHRDTTTDDATRQFRVEDPGVRAERRPLTDDGGAA